MGEEDIGDPIPIHTWLGGEVYPSLACGADEHPYNGMRSAEHPKIVGTGLIALDWVIRQDTGSRIGAWAGGTCGNVLSILAYLDWDAFPVARLSGDGASKRIRCDMERWGVQLDWISCRPTADTPIIVQEIQRGWTVVLNTSSPGSVYVAVTHCRRSNQSRSMRFIPRESSWWMHRRSFWIGCLRRR